MAKAKSAAPAGAGNDNDLRELIVLMNSESAVVASRESFTSRSGTDTSPLNALLSGVGATLTPLFGSESRLPTVREGQFAPSAEAVADLIGYYAVNTTADKEQLAKQLRKDPNVEAAYVKPPAEPPIIREDIAPPIGGDTPPATPDFNARQIYLDAAPAGIDARYAWTLPGGKGDGVRVIDIEGAWRFSHEDLIANQGGVIAGTPSADIGWRNHGTAVVGEFGGDENSFGVTGICPNANVRAISIFNAAGGANSANAIRQAADALSAGDIILIELHRPGPALAFAGRADQRGYIAVEWWPDDFAAIRYAISRGVIVVEAAGNGAENFDTPIYNTRPAGFPASWTNPFNMANPQSGAVIVGAGAPPPGTHGRNHGVDRSRLDFSNFGARVDVQGWGREVTTCGYGDLQGGPNEDFWYTDTFSGTSSASPIVVGALGSIQGRLRARSKPLLTPATAQTLLRNTGSVQQDNPGRPATQRIGNRPNLRQAFENLGVGGVAKTTVKDLKDIRKEVKEIRKELIKETKEVIKEIRKDTKELKEFTKDIKEKEFKEHKEFREVGGIDVRPTQSPDAPDAEARLQNLESAIEMLTHFITTELRPDLQQALFNNPDDPEKNAADSKQAKDHKDTREV
ncbi:S8 family serine peptidase [Paraflavitalea sp. CAU 1676]|uniref:S8 family serine peptidase n=1 Tax=Paraflavitalea sp. CAU 1676 TaxID=3032598 RepID=UPI0023D99BDF|nr:S8 family serine peptidase [Paraflavitalea sp. CAU 1676]MDF2192094.1 S8 family serine peptidase [Paraflavitalea sp. CAU 1676]